jgi:hypothetical protein
VGGVCGGVGSLLTFDIPQTALVATLDTYDLLMPNFSSFPFFSKNYVKHIFLKILLKNVKME